MTHMIFILVHLVLLIVVLILIYLILIHSIVNMFKCPDYGLLGAYLEADYSVECRGEQYNTHFVLALVGVVVYIIGIPAFFYFCIYCREKQGFEAIHLLYKNYVYSFRYYEIVDLMRRFLLTSMVIFVANPSSPSRPLFLFFVDLVALVLLCLFCPYFYQSDDILSVTLISVEMLSFIFAIIVLSDISEEGNYDEAALYNTLFVIIVLAIFTVPLTFMLKFQRLNRWFGINLLSKGETASEDNDSNYSAGGEITHVKRRSRLSTLTGPPGWVMDSTTIRNPIDHDFNGDQNESTRVARARSRSRFSGTKESTIKRASTPPRRDSSKQQQSASSKNPPQKRSSTPIVKEPSSVELRSFV